MRVNLGVAEVDAIELNSGSADLGFLGHIFTRPVLCKFHFRHVTHIEISLPFIMNVTSGLRTSDNVI